MISVILKHLPPEAEILPPASLDQHRGRHVLAHAAVDAEVTGPDANFQLGRGVWELETDDDVQLVRALPAGSVRWYALKPPLGVTSLGT